MTVGAGHRLGWRASLLPLKAALLSLVGLLSVSRTAHPEPFELVWEAPQGCPSRGQVLEQLSLVLGTGGASSAGGPQLQQVLGQAHTRGVIAADGPGWVLTLQVGDGSAERQRRLEATQCETLGHAAALALALLLEQEFRAAEPERAAGYERAAPPAFAAREQPGDTAASTGKDDLRATPPEHETAAARQDPLASVGVEGVLDSATLGQAALGLGASLDVRLGAWGAGAFGRWLPAKRSSLSSTNDYVEFEHWAVGLRACPLRWGERWELEGCGSGEFGRVLGRGIGLVQARSVSSPWLAAALGLGLRWNRPSGAFQVRTELALPLQRQRYVVDLAHEVHLTPFLTWRLALGVDLDL